MKRCIIYARIGGSASEVNNSLMQAQLAWLRAAAKCLGLEVVAELPVFEYGRAELIPPVYAFYSRYRTEGGPAFGSRNKK